MMYIAIVYFNLSETMVSDEMLVSEIPTWVQEAKDTLNESGDFITKVTIYKAVSEFDVDINLDVETLVMAEYRQTHPNTRKVAH